MTINDREILEHAGKISHELAIEKAENEYEMFHSKRLENKNKLESDFEQTIKKFETKNR